MIRHRRRATKRRPSADDEHTHQRRVVAALRAAGVTFCASVVDGITTGRAGAKAVSLGYESGDPDLRIYDPPPAFPGCHSTALEMKRPGAAPKTTRAHRFSPATPAQRARLALLEDRGWLVIVGCGFDDAMTKLRAAGYPIAGHAGSDVSAGL